MVPAPFGVWVTLSNQGLPLPVLSAFFIDFGRTGNEISCLLACVACVPEHAVLNGGKAHERARDEPRAFWAGKIRHNGKPHPRLDHHGANQRRSAVIRHRVGHVA